MSSHFKTICECGVVITQCRCPSKDKTINVVSPCKHIPEQVAASFLGETGDLQEEDLRPEFMRGIDA